MTRDGSTPRLTTPYRDALPPLSTSEREALRISIETAGGVRNACIATEDRRLLDGHNRLDIDPNAPVAFVPGSASWTDEECLAFIYRCARERRNLSPTQKAEVRKREMETARKLRESDHRRYTEPVLAQMFGVTRQAISGWLTSNASACITCEFDAKVKISPARHDAILARAEAGESQSQIAADYGVNQQQISNIVAQAKRKRAERLGECESTAGCTVDDLRLLIDRKQRFGTIYADPPWQYANQGTRAATDNHYGTMTVADICALPIADLAANDAHLHIWTTNAFLFDTQQVIEAWGFEYRSAFIWVKPQMGIGNYWRVAHEFLLLGVRGAAKSFRNQSLISWREIPCSRHSAKPERVREFVEKASPGPRLELFGRSKVPGWVVWGNQIDPQEQFRFDARTEETVA